MAEPIEVEIVEVCMVAPPPTVNPSPKSLPLTFFDIRWLRFPPYEHLFFYEIPTPNINKSSNFFFKSILPRLKHSLSLTLLHFLPITGNLTWPPTSPNPGVEYSESDAVSLTVAKSTADFYRLSGTNDVFCKAADHRSLIPKLSASHERVAVLAIQVTDFPDHGFSIGITMHHAVLDGKSFHLFMKSWAHICRSLGSGDHSGDVHHDQLPPELTPVYDRTHIKDPADVGTFLSNRWQNMDGPDNRSLLPWKGSYTVQPDSVRGTFQLPRAKIEKLKQLVNDQKHCPIRASTFLVTCAYTWICLVKAEEISDNEIPFTFAMDLRSRLEPPIPATYFGNCVGENVIVVEREALLGKEGLFVAVNAISEAIKGLNEGPLDGAENWVASSINAVKTFPRQYSVASSPRFEVYDTDFGWGKPREVDVVSIDGTGAICLSENRNGEGGIEIGLVLLKHHMEACASLFAEGLESLIRSNSG
ncbi:Anthocyanin 5-aromatic acyltransferase [Morus notabilis]|uniref:Anthocyanin 5-aromatic acyltransferase n=1 Tax=Morus notabilis TaxID=981085 RepID=W9QR15_9ROSA|nr:malonyl-CoA:anthocyanidin 5-O-glucoside-6''-O-malonyltransferase [Morus notabilis]EXB38119.1 Anthocyanin 5-aromatic acyltransferase [Morus notabilis]